MATSNPSPSSAALDVLLDLEGDLDAKRIRKRFNRSHLHLLRKGQKQPDANTITAIYMLSSGRVSAAGWGVPDPLTMSLIDVRAVNDSDPPHAA